jgi:hypothetical protein
VHQTTTSIDAYPFAMVRTSTGFSGSALQFPSIATAPTRSTLDVLMQQQTALFLLEHRWSGTPPPRPVDRSEIDLSDWTDAGEEPEVAYVAPADVSEVSVTIERAIRDEGMTYAALARRMAVPRSVVTRLTDPFYFGHTTRTLRRVADALGLTLRVDFVAGLADDRSSSPVREPSSSHA